MNHFLLSRTCSDTGARLGELHTAHGSLPTPAFMPVASYGTIKALTPDDVAGVGVGMLLSNTYHLYLRPGIELISSLGGLHRFMHWERPILTDSGGYQLFSLAPFQRLSEEGVTFRSHIDGSQHFLSPELAVEYQERLGADIIMCLDVCPPHGEDTSRVREAMERTHRWADRCRRFWAGGGERGLPNQGSSFSPSPSEGEGHQVGEVLRQPQFLYGIVQGGTSAELRRESAGLLSGLDFPGYALGGLSLGEPKEAMWGTVAATVPFLPADKPRYLMGVGSPEDIVEGVALGIDLFDSALPTRVARNGGLFTPRGRCNLKSAPNRSREEAVDPECDCYTCRNFSLAYLHHLFRCRELSVYRLATIHNLRFLARLVDSIQAALREGSFAAFRQQFLAGYRVTDEETRLAQKEKWLSRRPPGPTLAPAPPAP
ncbi:MAG: tRNA guanosine(34) transglycosylase Tgt [Chloroflexota bacterium]